MGQLKMSRKTKKINERNYGDTMLTNEALQMQNDILFKENEELKEEVKGLKAELEEIKDDDDDDDCECDECSEKDYSIKEMENANTLLKEMFDKVSDITHAAGLKNNMRELLDEIDKIASIVYQARII